MFYNIDNMLKVKLIFENCTSRTHYYYYKQKIITTPKFKMIPT